MTLIGIALRRPRFEEFTAASVMSAGLWVLILGLARAGGAELTAGDAASLLLVVWWSCVAVRCGIDLAAGWRHWLVHGVVAVALVATPDLLWTIAAG